MPVSLDFIGGVIGFAFTIMILSYLIGDNPLYRIASYTFVGVSAGYIATIAYWHVLLPKLILPFISGGSSERVLLGVPLLFSTLVLMKISPRLTRLASPAMAYLVGVGTALAIGGALSGTLVPQFFSLINAFDADIAAARNVNFLEELVEGGIILAGAISTLVYFHYGAKKHSEDGAVKRLGLIELLAWVGSIFIAITLGVIFAGVFSAAVTALIERVHVVLLFIFSLIGPV